MRLFFLFLFVSTSAFSQSIHPAFTQLENEGSVIAYSVRDETGKEIQSWQSGINMQPASTQKLITAAAALYKLGKDYRFKTPVLLSGNKNNDILKSDIVIIGSGDPELGRAEGSADSIKTAIVNALTQRGIKRIIGAITVDVSVYPYDHRGVPRFWPYEDLGNYYGAAVYGINWRGNSFTVEFRATKAGQKADYNFVDYTPHNMSLGSEVITCRGAEEVIYMWGSPGRSSLDADGCVPEGQIRRERGALPHPPIQLDFELKNLLDSKFPGSDLSTHIYTFPYEGKGDTLLVLESRPLSGMINDMLLKSDNLLAEALLKRMAADAGKDTRAEKAVELVIEYLSAFGYPELNGFHPMDGSGLSPTNLETAAFQTAFLHHLQQHPDFEILYNALPEAGKSGTLRRFEAIPGLRAKTGSINGVRSYMGYLDAKGKRYSFSIMMNHISADDRKLPAESAANFLKTVRP
ncbi:MAG: D-alanyl-D-alanine carboxypeptidase/D-alanyl-D-alanine-endopeptidase [Bacteroidia bacterium]